MVEFDVGNRTGQEAIDYSWSLGERAAAECTALFKKPNDLELEKVYYPFLLYSKKRYAAKLWEKNKKNDRVEFQYVDVKGLQLVRRDNTPHRARGAQRTPRRRAREQRVRTGDRSGERPSDRVAHG